MHLIESGDAEVIVFGEMSKIFFFFHHYQWGVFFMKSILNKSYHRCRALWSPFVTCGCGCVFNFLSIKSKYTPFIFSPHCEIQTRGVNMSRQVRNIHLYLPDGFSFFLFSFHCWSWWCDSTGKTVPARLLSNTPTNLLTEVCGGGGGGGGGGWREEKEILSSRLVLFRVGWGRQTNTKQVQQRRKNFYFVIKWLLIRVSRSRGAFDQR